VGKGGGGCGRAGGRTSGGVEGIRFCYCRNMKSEKEKVSHTTRKKVSHMKNEELSQMNKEKASHEERKGITHMNDPSVHAPERCSYGQFLCFCRFKGRQTGLGW
jgi:hypothetical protein